MKNSWDFSPYRVLARLKRRSLDRVFGSEDAARAYARKIEDDGAVDVRIWHYAERRWKELNDAD